jgi:hypothetical protein
MVGRRQADHHKVLKNKLLTDFKGIEIAYKSTEILE